MRKFLLFLLMLALPSLVTAQTVPPANRLSSTSSLSITWPAAPTSADGLDAPDGYRVRAVNPTATGTVIREWTTTAAVTTLTLTPAMIPATGPFSITVHAYNAEGTAEGSAPVGPFGRTRIPGRVPSATATVGAP